MITVTITTTYMYMYTYIYMIWYDVLHYIYEIFLLYEKNCTLPKINTLPKYSYLTENLEHQKFRRC